MIDYEECKKRNDAYWEKYCKEVELLLNNASPLALKICRTWNSNFGKPGWGDIEYIMTELHWANLAVEAMK